MASAQWRRTLISACVLTGVGVFLLSGGLATAQVVGGAVVRGVGGVAIQADGMVTPADKSVRIQMRDALRAQLSTPAGELGQAVPLRLVSLRRIDELARAAGSSSLASLPDEARYLGGLTRIRYVLVYPEEHDIVLAGPGEGWKVDEGGNVVGATSGRPVLHLEDLLVALRSVERARQGGITCSIDPTPEGRQRLSELLGKSPSFSGGTLAAMRKALGPQQITIAGVPADSRFARILVASDYQMKRIAMQLAPSPLKALPSFLEMLQQDAAPLSTMMPRWWLECDYEPLGRSEDGLAFEIRGRGVKCLTEEEVLDAQGQLASTGKAHPLAKEWADRMTAHYEELADREPVFAELRNLMDLCLVAALLAREQLLAKADCPLPSLGSPEGGLGYEPLPAPRSVPTQTSAIKRGREYIVTASGGVAITAWSFVERKVAAPELAQTHLQGRPRGAAAACWNGNR
jgi:hypothetical protein